jgi:predicted nucleic acid-binding protein
MAELFADTSGWGCLFDAAQPYHVLVANLYRGARTQNRKIITTNYILTELVALLTNPLRIPRPTIIELVDGLKNTTHVEVLHVDESLDHEAWLLFRRRPDKQWSWVDCTSFVVMQQRGIQEALTTDHHFEQAGFVRLLKA